MPSRLDDGKALPPSKLAPSLLLGLFAILTAAIGGVTWRFYVTQKEAFERAAQTQLLTIADAKVRQIAEWRKVRLGEAHSIMADTFTLAALQRVVEGKTAQSERTAVVSYLRSICANLHYAGAVLVDREGREVLSEGRKFGHADHLKETMQRVIATGDIVERDFDVADSPGDAHLGFNLPLRAGAGSPVFGGLLLSIDPQDYLYPIQTWPVPSRSGEVLLVRRDGQSVLYLSSLRNWQDAALRLRVTLNRGDVAAVMAVQGRQGNVKAVDYRGRPVFAALRPVPDTAWFLIAKMDSEEVGEPIRRRSLLLGITAVSLILTAGALVLFLWRREQLNLYRQRYESELAHRALVEQYNYLSRFANDVILLIDDDGIIVSANDRAADVYGYSQSEITGMSIRRLRASAIQHTFDADWQLAHERGSLIFETVHQRKDGSEFAVEVSTRSIAVDGKTLQQSIIRDISDRKRAEQELSESESRFRQLVEHAPYGIIVVEGQLIVYANPEAVRTFGASTPGDLVGHSLLERARAEEHESMKRRVWEVIAGVSLVVERRYLRLNGEEFWAAVSAAEIEYNHRPAGLLFYRDITAVKRAEEEHARLEEQLRQSQKMESVGRLAGGVAHDFNNYLTVINGYCEMLLENSDAGPEIRDGLQEIRAAGGRAAAITQQLLAFSRKQIATPVVLSLNQVVTDSGQLLQRLIGEDITIVTRLDTDPGNVIGDPQQLGQVLMNLVINARDAMPHGGQIVIETGKRKIDEVAASRSEVRPGRYSVLSVADTGVGMSAEIQQRIFEPFFTTKGVGTGTGLGLSTAYGIVRHAGGWIDVQSSRGTGSRFEIWLPLTDVAAADADAGAPQAAASVARGAETLLVVEDQDDVRRMALAILKANGYRLLEAGNAEQALGLSATYGGKIDLLLTDVIMPGLNGRQLADRLVEERPGLKVLYTSGYAADVITLQGSLEPGMEYLPKPFGAAQLSAKVRQVLSSGMPKGRLLLIEDDTGVRRLLRQILTGAGYSVMEAGDGRSGVSKLERHAIDLVITDLVMPEQEGLETLRHLRATRPELPVIAISGAFGGSFLKTARRFGAIATLPKPIDSEELLRAVRQALTSSAAPQA